MDIIAQQSWFIKLLWACFGVNASEMGFTEDSNRATEAVQSVIVKRKVIKPLLSLLEWHINRSIIPEFGVKGAQFKFIDFDLLESHSKADLFQKELTMGIRSRRSVAEEMGFDYDQMKAEIEQEPQPPSSLSALAQSGIQPGAESPPKEESGSHLLPPEEGSKPGLEEQSPEQEKKPEEKQPEEKAVDAELAKADDLLVLNDAFKEWGEKLNQFLDKAGGETRGPLSG